jgi:hypothetical protein
VKTWIGPRHNASRFRSESFEVEIGRHRRINTVAVRSQDAAYVSDRDTVENPKRIGGEIERSVLERGANRHLQEPVMSTEPARCSLLKDPRLFGRGCLTRRRACVSCFAYGKAVRMAQQKRYAGV